MTNLNPTRCTLSVCAAATILSGCGGSEPAIGVPGATPQGVGIAAPESGAIARTIVDHVAPAFSYEVLHSFHGGRDGANPEAGLLDVNGTFYGTTYNGGFGGCGGQGCGTVFSISRSGQERVIHRFKVAGHDGLWPAASLVERNGTLYGESTSGGNPGYGAIFSITPSGTESILYSFKTSNNGDGPYGGLAWFKGWFYGTTAYGGGGNGPPLGEGTVFKVTTSGVEHKIYRFRGEPDSEYPFAGLTVLNDTLYGTTAGSGFGADVGSVFSVTTSGDYKLLHSFLGVHGDGALPEASLTVVNGLLYGTTKYGGAHGGETVFNITTSGNERVVYSFGSKKRDGSYPVAPLIVVNGVLYGTTYAGGKHDDGTAFSVTTSGVESVLHDFNGTAGANPAAGLTYVKGSFYGTTQSGGEENKGAVFALTP